MKLSTLVSEIRLCLQGTEDSSAFYIQAEPHGLLPPACQSEECLEFGT